MERGARNKKLPTSGSSFSRCFYEATHFRDRGDRPCLRVRSAFPSCHIEFPT